MQTNLTLPELITAYLDGLFTLSEFDDRLNAHFPQAVTIIRSVR